MIPGIDQHTNFSKGQLLQGYTLSDTTISFIPGGGSRFPTTPTGNEFNLVWWNNTDYADPADDPQVEIVRVVNTSGDVFQILRAQEGTAATNKNIPNKTYKMILSFTQHVLDEIIDGAGTGTVTMGENEGTGLGILDTVNSTAETLVFKSLTAGANITLVDNGESISISASGGGGGGGYNLIENTSGTMRIPITQETTIVLSPLLIGSDSLGASLIDINVVNLAADNTFATDLANNTTFDSTLANNTTFINDLTTNGTFQTNVTTFVSGTTINPAGTSFLYEDFVGGGYHTFGGGTSDAILGELGWSIAVRGTVVRKAGVANHPGILSYQSDSSTNGGGIFLGADFGTGQWESLGLLTTPNVTLSFDVQILEPITQGEYFVGLSLQTFGSDFSANTAPKVGFVMKSGTATWAGYACDGVTQNITGSTAVSAENIWYTLTLVTDNTGANVEFFVNGVSIGSVAIPATPINCSANFQARQTSAVAQIEADYFTYKQILTR